jgi:hypothetical protein
MLTPPPQVNPNTGLAQRYWGKDRLDANRKTAGSTPPRNVEALLSYFS